MRRINENEFKLTCRGFLDRQTISSLRPYGRKVGVAEPTAKTKQALIEDIIAILAGEQSPTPRSQRGAPVRDDFVDPYIVERMEEICKNFPDESEYKFGGGETTRARLQELKKNPIYWKVEDPNAARMQPKGQRVIFRGQYTKKEKSRYLQPLIWNDVEDNIRITSDTEHNEQLREGDVVTCYAEREGEELIATEVVTISGTLMEFFRRGRFEEFSACYPHRKMQFFREGTNEKLSDKYFDWLLPMGRGQRGLLISPPKAGKSTLLLDMADSIQRCNPDVKVLVLLVEQSPESIGQFRKRIDREKLVYTTYEDTPEKQIEAAEFLLSRAKRLAECGRQVCLLVDSMNALAHAYNDTNESLGGRTLAGGVESKTLQYIKRYFGTARCLENGGAITMLGALSVDTGDPADALLETELTALANYRVYLQESLAKRRIYPAIDFAKTQGNQNGDLADCEETRLYERVKENYLPKQGAEKLLSDLSECSSAKQFQQKILQGD